jgi:hypothetical protein
VEEMSAISIALRLDLQRQEVWPHVQDSVKDRLEWIFTNIEAVGTCFSHTFMALFRLQYESRKIAGVSFTHPVNGILLNALGMPISEEAFQCGILATRATLDLYDFISPTDADVAICLYLCQKIDLLEKHEALTPPYSHWKTTPAKLNDLIAFRTKSVVGPIKEEVIKWSAEL